MRRARVKGILKGTNMKAFLLAAGMGKRLHPFTENKPKPLVKLGGVSLIERNILKLQKCGIEELIINLHHHGEKIVDQLGDGSKFNIKISYSVEQELLGTGGGVHNAIDHFDGPFILLSSDTFTDFNFKTLALREDLMAHMVFVPNPETKSEGDASIIKGKVDPDATEKKYTFSGLSVLSPELFDDPDIKKRDLWKDFLKPASMSGLVSGEIFEGTFENLNTLEDVERLDALLSEE